MKATFLAACTLLALAWPAAAQRAEHKSGRIPTDPEGNEVQKPIPVKEQDSRILHSMQSMPMEKLQELLAVYEKLDNTGMMDAIVRAILKRDPKNAEALRVRDEIDPKEVVRDAGYLEALAKKVLAGEVIDDVDGAGVHAATLLEHGKGAEGVKLLEALRHNQFKDKSFPFLDDLAYGYAETGNLDQAEKAYKAVLADSTFDGPSRDEAERALASLGTKRRIAGLRQAAGGDLEKLAASSAKLYGETPEDDDVMAFRLEALSASHHYDEAAKMLEPMRARWHGKSTWPYLSDLAQAYFGLKHYDQAINVYREIQKAPDLDTADKAEAESMILEIQVGRLIERGTSELDKAHFAEAKKILDQMEHDYHTHDDVLGFKALYLAKTGKSDEALALLFARKAEADKEQLPFSQQDVLADVYLERKEFGLARAATTAIVNDTRYDEEFRSEAQHKLQEISVAELLDQGYTALDDGKRSFALKIERQLEELVPGNLEVRIFEAEVALAYNQAVYARDHLTVLKKEMPDRPFPGQNALAGAMAETGRWEEGADAYEEVLTTPGYDLDDRWEALHARRELLPLFMATTRIENHFESSSEGTVFSTENRFTSRWYNNWRFSAFVRSDSTRLSSRNIFSSRVDNRYEGGITATRRFDNGYFAEATIGGSQDNVLYGARIGKVSPNALGWSLGFTGNGRATDSTTLQALDGRENRVDFKVSGPISERLLLDFEAYYNAVKIGGSKIGDGYGYEASLDYVIQTETRTRPEILLGYHGEYRHFDASGSLPRAIRDQIRLAEVPQTQVRPALASGEEVRRAVAGDFGREVFDELVDPETNRQGLELKIRKHLNDRWTGYVQAGTYYAFDDKSAGWDAAMGVEYWINDATMLYAELRYDSDGKGASAGSGAWEANLGGSVSF